MNTEDKIKSKIEKHIQIIKENPEEIDKERKIEEIKKRMNKILNQSRINNTEE
jgi:hypothetical protein